MRCPRRRRRREQSGEPDASVSGPSAFELMRCEDVEQDGPGGYHRKVLARLRDSG